MITPVAAGETDVTVTLQPPPRADDMAASKPAVKDVKEVRLRRIAARRRDEVRMEL